MNVKTSSHPPADLEALHEKADAMVKSYSYQKPSGIDAGKGNAVLLQQMERLAVQHLQRQGQRSLSFEGDAPRARQRLRHVDREGTFEGELAAVRSRERAVGNGQLERTVVEAQEMHWIAGAAPAAERLARIGAKTRYRMPDAMCRVELASGERAREIFDAPQWAPTPGQYLVLYDGDVCLGGGVIAATANVDASVTSEVAAEH